MKVMKTGFVSGCFDWLAPGHIRLFKEAKEMCEVLHLHLADDDTVRHYKGPTRPLLTYEERHELVRACWYVNHVWKLRKVAGESNQFDLIKTIQPDAYFEGSDATDKEIGQYLEELNVERITLYTKPLHVSDILARYDKRRYDPTQNYDEHLHLIEAAGL